MTETTLSTHAAAHAVAAASVAAELRVEPATGLSAAEAAARRERFGPNDLQAARGRARGD